MQWFKDRRTATKLMFGFGLLAVLIAGMGVLGIRGMAQIQASLRELHHNHALGEIDLEQANTHLVASGRAVRGMLLATDVAAAEQGRQEALSHRQQFFDEFDGYSKTLLTDE